MNCPKTVNSKSFQICYSGRSPWFRADGSNKHAYVIGITGGSGSGKTSVAERIIKSLDVPWVAILSMDCFYKILSQEQSIKAHQNRFDLDHPSALHYDLMFTCLYKLKNGQSIQVPVYNFAKHAREEKTTTLYGANVVIFEGIHALYYQEIRDLIDLKIFVDTDDDIRLARRIQRDMEYRGRDIQGIMNQYTRFVKPSFDNYVQSTMKHADVIIPRGLENAIAIDLVTNHVQHQLNKKEDHLRWDLAKTCFNDYVLEKVTVLPPTNQIRCMHTILRDKNTPRTEFVFYADRLARLIVECSLGLLPSEPTTITTPSGELYQGISFITKICGVSILRAGGTMEKGLRQVCNDITIGRLLIQADPCTREPRLHYFDLPANVKSRHVLLMDAMVGTAATALMAIRILLDHDVPEGNIIFLSFLATPIGLTVIKRAFPLVKIVISMIDSGISKETLWIEPGFGSFGDRYFGTEL